MKGYFAFKQRTDRRTRSWIWPKIWSEKTYSNAEASETQLTETHLFPYENRQIAKSLQGVSCLKYIYAHRWPLSDQKFWDAQKSFAIFYPLFFFTRTQGTLLETLSNSLQNARVSLNWFFKTKQVIIIFRNTLLWIFGRIPYAFIQSEVRYFVT